MLNFLGHQNRDAWRLIGIQQDSCRFKSSVSYSSHEGAAEFIVPYSMSLRLGNVITYWGKKRKNKTHILEHIRSALVITDENISRNLIQFWFWILNFVLFIQMKVTFLCGENTNTKMRKPCLVTSWTTDEGIIPQLSQYFPRGNTSVGLYPVRQKIKTIRMERYRNTSKLESKEILEIS